MKEENKKNIETNWRKVCPDCKWKGHCNKCGYDNTTSTSSNTINSSKIQYTQFQYDGFDK